MLYQSGGTQIASLSRELDQDDELIENIVHDMEEKSPPSGLGSRFLAWSDQHISKICLVTLTLFTTFIMLFIKYSKLDMKDKYVAF
jgi:hypothetical protein